MPRDHENRLFHPTKGWKPEKESDKFFMDRSHYSGNPLPKFKTKYCLQCVGSPGRIEKQPWGEKNGKKCFQVILFVLFFLFE